MVAGRSDLSASVNGDTVSVNKLAPALGGLLSTITGSTTLHLDLSDGVPGYANLTDAQGNVMGVRQGRQITLVNGGIPALDGNAITAPAPMLAAPSAAGGATTATATPPPVPSSSPPSVPANPLPAQAGTTASPDASNPTILSTPVPDGPAVPSVTPGTPTDGVQGPTVMANQSRGEDSPATGPFTSTDPLVADLADQIEAAKPGTVQGVNINVLRPDGTIATDIDIQTDQRAIQVKFGSCKGLTSQMGTTATSTG